jgi:hypothetical protein
MTFATSIPLGSLFADPKMFESRRAWKRAGFDVLDPAKETEVMVAAHASAPGCLFKKYAPDVSAKEQRANYDRRLTGSREVGKFVADQRLAHIVVPKKHLHDLGADAQILVVERLDVIGKEASAKRFRDVSEPVLREMLRVMVRYPGLDSNSKNVQFTRDGKIAFVDLEHWDRTDRDRVRLKSIRDYLSKDGRKIAKRILDELE